MPIKPDPDVKRVYDQYHAENPSGFSETIRDIYEQVQEKLRQWYLSIDDSWLDELPDCPCNIKLICECPADDWASELDGKWTAWKDKPQIANATHRGAVWEIRWYQGPNKPGQQCTYNSKGKLLIDPPAAGTPDRAGWSGHFKRDYAHVYKDLATYKILPEDMYIKKWPPNNGPKGCQPGQIDEQIDLERLRTKCSK